MEESRPTSSSTTAPLVLTMILTLPVASLAPAPPPLRRSDVRSVLPDPWLLSEERQVRDYSQDRQAVFGAPELPPALVCYLSRICFGRASS